MTDRIIAPFVNDLFARLSDKQIPWAVLRNAEGLPEWTRYDIDLLVDKTCVESSEAQLRLAADANGWRIIGVITKRCYQCFLLNKGTDFLPIDIFSDLEYRAHRIANTEVAFDHRWKNAFGIWCTPLGFDSAVTVVKELLPHGNLKENSRESVRSGLIQDMRNFRRAMIGIISTKLCDDLITTIVSEDWAGLAELTNRLRKEYRKFNWSYPFRGIDFLWKNARHHLSPSVSCMIAFMAPDGSGKTTVANELSAGLLKQPFKDCRYLRANFDVLPKLRSVRNFAAVCLGREPSGQKAEPPGTLNSGMIEPNSLLRSFIYTTYYTVDLFLGRFKLRRMRAQWNLVIFDRSFYDYYFQLGNSKCPEWYLRLLERFVPKPDMLIFLDRTAEEIFAGKPELAIHEIEREQNVIRRIVRDKPFGVVVDATGGVDNTVDQLKQLVLRKVA